MNDKYRVVRRLLDDYECKRHKSDLPCEECQRESEVEYQRGLAEYEEEQEAKAREEELREWEIEQEYLRRGPDG